MTRTIQAASWLATAALLMIPAAAAAQAATPPVNQASTATSFPTATAEEIEVFRADIRAKRKRIVAANMTLTADEATRFWPLFDEYTAEVRKINDKRWAMMKDYAVNRAKMTDAQAKDHMNQSASVDAELIDLRVKYVPQFEKLLSPKQAVQFYQLDRRLDLMMNLQISSLIPVISPTN